MSGKNKNTRKSRLHNFPRGILFALVFLVMLFTGCRAQERIITGAERTGEYLPMIMNKSIGVVANPTSVIGGTHLVDSLMSLETDLIRIWKVFSPEHGFRGEAEYGEVVSGGIDAPTGLPVISLYGINKKPSPAELRNLDVMLFDIQDVGVRFYTYISTLFYVMQACAEEDKELILLDRPNPNGFYVDGPLLDTAFRSFVGMHPVPLVYGMTIGEYAGMINGEGWLGKELQCKLTVITCLNYDHASLYQLPVKPSPNLPTMNSVYLYPSVCLFEGTLVSEARGTDFPFEAFGHPELENADFKFIPVSRPGAAMHPKLEGETCRGIDLRYLRDQSPRNKTFTLSWLLFAYQNFPYRENFFLPYFDLLAGTDRLRHQIASGMEEAEIRRSWTGKLDAFIKIREKYLLYPDFE